MNVVEMGPITVVGIRVVADWNSLWIDMPKAWSDFNNRYEEIANRASERFMDISLQKEGDLYTQMIGVEVSGVNDLPQGMDSLVIPRQRYLHHRHEGAMQEIAESFGAMHAWAEENGLDVTDFMVDIGYSPDQTEHPHDLYIRLK